MTMEQILEKIKQNRGEAVLGNGRQLAGLFADYSRGQLRPQANALDIFLKCEGNTRVLALRGAPEQKQRAEFHRLIQSMVSDYGIQEKIALEIGSDFWRIAIGTEPPVAVETYASGTSPVPAEKGTEPLSQVLPKQSDCSPANQPASRSARQTTAQEKASREDRKPPRIFQNFLRLSTHDRVVFLVGLVGLVPFAVFLIDIVPSLLRGSSIASVGSGIFFVYYLPLLVRVVLLWKRGFLGTDYKSSSLQKASELYSKIVIWIHALLMLAFIALPIAPIFGGWDGDVQDLIQYEGISIAAICSGSFQCIWHWNNSV